MVYVDMRQLEAEKGKVVNAVSVLLLPWLGKANHVLSKINSKFYAGFVTG